MSYNIEFFKKALIKLLKDKYLYSINNINTRNNLISDINKLFNKFLNNTNIKEEYKNKLKDFIFFDNTEKFSDIDKGEVIIMVKYKDKEFSVSEFLNKLDKYL